MYRFNIDYLKEPIHGRLYAHLICIESDLGHSLAIFHEPGKNEFDKDQETPFRTTIEDVEKDITIVINQSKTLINARRITDQVKLPAPRIVTF